MSAFVCSDKHISAIIGAVIAASPQPGSMVLKMNAKAIGQCLLDENHASVNARYGESESSEFTLDDASVDMPVTPAAAESLIRSLQYQSCEHESWPDSNAFKMLGHFQTLLGIPKGADLSNQPWSL